MTSFISLYNHRRRALCKRRIHRLPSRPLFRYINIHREQRENDEHVSSTRSKKNIGPSQGIATPERAECITVARGQDFYPQIVTTWRSVCSAECMRAACNWARCGARLGSRNSFANGHVLRTNKTNSNNVCGWARARFMSTRRVFLGLRVHPRLCVCLYSIVNKVYKTHAHTPIKNQQLHWNTAHSALQRYLTNQRTATLRVLHRPTDYLWALS